VTVVLAVLMITVGVAAVALGYLFFGLLMVAVLIVMIIAVVRAAWSSIGRHYRDYDS